MCFSVTRRRRRPGYLLVKTGQARVVSRLAGKRGWTKMTRITSSSKHQSFIDCIFNCLVNNDNNTYHFCSAMSITWLSSKRFTQKCMYMYTLYRTSIIHKHFLVFPRADTRSPHSPAEMYVNVVFVKLFVRAQELCESRGGRLGLPSLTSLWFLWT